MTRSIGDWDAARSCIPEPEIQRFCVREGGHCRVALASDGLWDFCSFQRAAKIVRGAATAQVAADALVALVERESERRFGRLKDDTTVAVLELDLRSEEARQAAHAAQAGGCCVVS